MVLLRFPCWYSVQSSVQRAHRRSPYHVELKVHIRTRSGPEHRAPNLRRTGTRSTFGCQTSEYMQRRRVKVSAKKTIASVFQLRNHATSGILRSNLIVCSTYRSLTYLEHCLNLKNKVNSRVGFPVTNGKLISQHLGARPAYSAAEYCVPVRCRSSHRAQVDVHLNDAMRLMSACLRSTTLNVLNVLPHLSGI